MTAKKKTDPYQVVTDGIVGALEAGIVAWHQPWKAIGDGPNAPRSLSTGRPYRGINVFLLGATALVNGYDSPWWTTFNQAKDRGGSVRRGEKATPIVFWKFIERPDPDNPTGVKRIPFLRYFSVFNSEQVDDLEVPTSDVVLAEHEPIEACEEIVRGYSARNGGPRLRHGGDSAWYAPALDLVRVPTLGQFETPETYYSTLFHEFGHSTGHETRLGRKGVVNAKPFGTPDYSDEELVAEMTAAFVCGEAGIDVNYPLHAGYLDSWMARLGRDPKLVVHAGGQAQKAADLILGRVPDAETNNQPREAVPA